MLLFALVVACWSPPSPAAPPADPAAAPAAPAGKRSDVDVAGLAAALEQGAPLIDVRTAEEFAAGRVPGAVNLPLGSFQATDDALKPYADAPVYLICQSGGRSGRAADQLAAGGFQAINVKGGTSAWVAAGHPVDK